MALTHFSGPLSIQSTQALSGAGAIDVVNYISEWTTTGADAGTLADGEEGQHKVVIMVVDGGVGTLTPSNFSGGASMAFDNVGDCAHLLFSNGDWNLIGQNGLVIA